MSLFTVAKMAALVMACAHMVGWRNTLVLVAIPVIAKKGH